MKEKKVSADWYIAATHWLTTLITATVGSVLFVLLFTITGNPLIVFIASMIAWPFMVWLGIIYSVRYLNKSYIIKNPNQIVILSTIYLVIVAGGFRLYEFMQTGVIQMEYISFVVGVIIFYFLSKKYLKESI
jgi:hypothetical protein